MTLREARQVRDQHRVIWDRLKDLLPKHKRNVKQKDGETDTTSPQFELDLNF